MPNMTGARVPPYNGSQVILRHSWQSNGPIVSRPVQLSIEQGDARGAREVRCGISSILFE